MGGGDWPKKPLVIDWNVVLDDDEAPEELYVVRDKQSCKSEHLQTVPDHNLHETSSRLTKEFNVLSSNLPDKGDKLRARIQSIEYEKKRRSFLPLNKGQSQQTVVLVDEEDCPSVETTLQKDQPIGWKMDTKIYYPSRNDPESVELCHSDIDCLAPKAFISSTIMNFYIRYLRRPVSPTGRPRGDYYFFNTYFYKKLKEAVSYKKSEKDAFVKLRRWWKGVNIFQKAYILLPIHENLHWSLAIICSPDKAEESEQIILLHLDSLGCHPSRKIFKNIRSFLKEEWKYLREEVVPPDPSVGDRVRSNLQDEIIYRRIMVPQQKNAYDCGIFVLYFMERFIEEAPERIKKKDLANLAEWFKPEEASGLRGRIRELLIEEFENARIENLSRESSPLSSGDDDKVENTKDHSDS